MARPKKDGRKLNLYVDRKIVESLEAYASAKHQTLTAALEDLLQEALKNCADHKSK